MGVDTTTDTTNSVRISSGMSAMWPNGETEAKGAIFFRYQFALRDDANEVGVV